MSPSDNHSKANGILLEDLHAKMDLVIENMSGVEGRLVRRMDNMEQRLIDRMDDMELKLIHRMDDKFALQDIRFDAVEVVLDKHGQRLDRIEHTLERQ